jgi:hypothetical protein
VKSDAEIDALYQVPLGEFTSARNALAKARGAAGAEIRTLEKPSAAAWAVNQLYWQRRPVYDKVIRAATAMREAHAKMISGRGGDVRAAETAHRDAMRAATDVIRELLKSAGESTSAATFDAVAETLQALPSDDPPGRLTKPLKPLGFGALLAMGIAPSVPRSGSPGVQKSAGVQGSGVPSPVPGVQSPAIRAAAKKEAAELAAKKKALEKQLRTAEAAEQAADAAEADARKSLAKVERDYAATRDKLQFLEKQRADAEQDVQRRAKAAREAANARVQAAQDLARLPT